MFLPAAPSLNRWLRATDGSAHPDYRFTLANERTLLAWLRTGLAVVAGGVAVAAYVPDLGARWASSVVALALVLIGLGIAVARVPPVARQRGGDPGRAPAAGELADAHRGRAPWLRSWCSWGCSSVSRC